MKALECLGRGRKFLELMLGLGTAAGEVRLSYLGVKITPKLTFPTTTDTPYFKSGDGGNKRHL
jgi:hypothetical protein